jgi:hypothetical protein
LLERLDCCRRQRIVLSVDIERRVGDMQHVQRGLSVNRGRSVPALPSTALTVDVPV